MTEDEAWRQGGPPGGPPDAEVTAWLTIEEIVKLSSSAGFLGQLFDMIRMMPREGEQRAALAKLLHGLADFVAGVA